MQVKSPAKQERVVETVRRGLSGEAAVDFVRLSGYAMSETAIVRTLQQLGGLGRIQEWIAEGRNNNEILRLALPSAKVEEAPHLPEAWTHPPPEGNTLVRAEDHPLYETAKMTVHLPADVYEAVRLAARAEGKTQNQLIVELLTTGLSRLPRIEE